MVARVKSERRDGNVTAADSIVGCRILNEGSCAAFNELEFLVKLGTEEVVWLPGSCVSEDLRQTYEASWWRACREGGDPLKDHLSSGGDVLILARDTQLRSGLHYACGRGDVEAVDAMLACGAEIDAVDKDGYTPLHIAAGYLHEEVISVLMKSGADPALEDNSGRSALNLIEMLLQNTPATAALFSKRLAMESVSKTLRNYMFEEIVPNSIIEKRSNASQNQFLVSWLDGYEPIWVDDVDVADDLINEFDQGLERACGRMIESAKKMPGIDDDVVLVKVSVSRHAHTTGAHLCIVD